MDQPEELILSKDIPYFRLGRMGIVVGIGIMVFVSGIALTQTDATLADLLLPMATLSVFWLAWLAINTAIGLIHVANTKRDINRFFEREIWQQWQFGSNEWQRIVEAEYQLMYPDDRVSAYLGAVFSAIAGLVMSFILVAVGQFAIKDEQVMPIIFICAGAVLILFIGVGLFQPLQARNRAQTYRRKALQVREPRVRFGSEGVYHEAFGYSSLKKLTDVNNHTKTLKAIKFTVKVTTVMGGEHSSVSKDYLTMLFSVPSGYEQQAEQLVRRYRQKRLHD